MMMIGGTAAAGGGDACTTSNDGDRAYSLLSATADNGTDGLSSGGTGRVLATKFTTSAADYVTGYYVRALTIGGATGTDTISLQTSSSDLPSGSDVSGSSVVVNANSWSGACSDVWVELPATIQLSASTSYWIVNAGSATVELQICGSTGQTGARISYNGTGYNDQLYAAKIYGCSP
jgi:hypothetical protein